jgi:enamine deaminase RidA (YjgF/YER057c/UK114 family)
MHHTERPDMSNTPHASNSASPESRLAALGLVLPTPPKPVAAYIPFRISGRHVYIAGQIPFRDGKLIATGAVPSVVPVPLAIECARQCTLNGLAIIRDAVAAAGLEGGLSRVVQFVRLGVFVACGSEFADHPKVANGASELLVEVFGDRGKHARAAVGSPSLPLGAPVEVEFVVEIG